MQEKIRHKFSNFNPDSDFNIIGSAYEASFDSNGNINRLHVGLNDVNYVNTKEGRKEIEGANQPASLKLQRYAHFFNELEEMKLGELGFNFLGMNSQESYMLISGWSYNTHGDAADPDQKPYRWAAGGALPILADGNAVFIYSDKRAPNYPNHLTIPSGLSYNEKEALNPNILMLRTAAFEDIIFAKGKTLLVPSIEEDLEELVERNNMANNLIKRASRLYSISSKDSIRASTPKPKKELLIDHVQNYSFPVNLDNTIIQRVGGFVLDPQTKGADVVGVINYKDLTLDDLKSGEIRILDGKGLAFEGKPFKRDIYVARPSEVGEYLKGNNKRFKATKFNGNNQVITELDVNFKFTPIVSGAVSQVAPYFRMYYSDLSQIKANLLSGIEKQLAEIKKKTG